MFFCEAESDEEMLRPGTGEASAVVRRPLPPCTSVELRFCDMPSICFGLAMLELADEPSGGLYIFLLLSLCLSSLFFTKFVYVE